MCYLNNKVKLGKHFNILPSPISIHSNRQKNCNPARYIIGLSSCRLCRNQEVVISYRSASIYGCFSLIF